MKVIRSWRTTGMIAAIFIGLMLLLIPAYSVSGQGADRLKR